MGRMAIGTMWRDYTPGSLAAIASRTLPATAARRSWRPGAAALAMAPLLALAALPLGEGGAALGALAVAGVAAAAALGASRTKRRLRALLAASRRGGARDRARMRAVVADYRESADALREAKEVAERACRARTDFLGVISHELRTPLNGALGTIGLLADSRLTEEQRTLLGAVQDSAASLVSILNTILDFTDLEEGRLTVERAPVHLDAQWADLEASARPRAGAKGLTLELRISETVPARVLGDGRRLRQMLDALVDNAIKFTDRGGVVIAVDAERRGAGRDATVRVTVTDTGVGIADDRRAEVFGDLARLDPSYARRFAGTGLGLAVTKRLAGLMGGRIGVEAGPGGQGCRFWIELPLEVAPSPSPMVARRAAAITLPAPAPGAASLRRVVGRGAPRILVAEDTPTNQLIARTLLERAGCRVDVVACGADAVAAVAHQGYDLILMDIAMPGMDGIEATRRIRALSGAGRRTPIVAVTANLAGEERQTYLAAGMDDCLLKPFRADDLKAMVARMLTPAAPATAMAGDEAAAGDRPDTAPLFDADTLTTLGGEIDPEAMSGILVSFVQDMTTRLDRIATAVDSANLRAIAFESHAVSSCSRTFGAMRLARVCHDIEHAVEDGDDREALTLARSLGPIGTETLHALSEYRGTA